MAENKKKNKKVNKLTLQECETVLFKLGNQTQNKYYKNVFERMMKLKNN